MTDYIRREDAIDVIARYAKTEDIVEGYTVGKWNEYVEFAKERLAEVPSEDVTQVVWCKDCKWQEECVITELWGGGNGYCRSGERKDDE